MLLTGEYINKVDDKGRLMIPSKLRSALSSSQVVASKGLDGSCIALFPPDFFDKTFSFAISGDDGLDFDSSGRVNLPQSLRTYAGIDLRSEVTILGMGKYIEIWNPEKYNELLAADDVSISDLGEALAKNKRGV